MNYSAITGPRRCDADARGWHFMVATSGNIHDLCADPSKSQGLGGGPAMARRPAGLIPRGGALRHHHFWPNAIALSPSKIRAFNVERVSKLPKPILDSNVSRAFPAQLNHVFLVHYLTAFALCDEPKLN